MEHKHITEEGVEGMDRYYSMYRGYVADNQDPENLGRLKVYIPEIYGDDVHDYWAPSKSPVGTGMGMYWIPNNDDPLWISFQNGDVRFPIWDYGLWETDNAPKDRKGNPVTPDIKLLYSQKHRLEFDDKANVATLLDGTGNALVLDSYGLSMVPKSGKKISLGKLDGSSQKALLGNDTISLLSDVLDGLIALTVPTPSGTSSPPVNLSTFASIKARLNTLLSQVVTLE